MANPTTPGRSGDVTIVTAGPADPRTSSSGASTSGASTSGAGNSVAGRPDAGNPHMADADATNPGEAAPSAATSTATAASPRGPGAANPVGAGRVMWPAPAGTLIWPSTSSGHPVDDGRKRSNGGITTRAFWPKTEDGDQKAENGPLRSRLRTRASRLST